MDKLLDFLYGAWFDILVIALFGAVVAIGIALVLDEPEEEPVDYHVSQCVGTAYNYECWEV